MYLYNYNIYVFCLLLVGLIIFARRSTSSTSQGSAVLRSCNRWPLTVQRKHNGAELRAGDSEGSPDTFTNNLQTIYKQFTNNLHTLHTIKKTSENKHIKNR